MYHRILIPTDGSEVTAKAVNTAIGLARAFGARLDAVAVKEPFPYATLSEVQAIAPTEFFEAQERACRARVQAVVEAASNQGVVCEGYTIEGLSPWEALLDHARTQGCDCIVMASHGRRGMAALLLGSETQRVLLHSTVPVLVVK